MVAWNQEEVFMVQVFVSWTSQHKGEIAQFHDTVVELGAMPSSKSDIDRLRVMVSDKIHGTGYPIIINFQKL